MANQFYGGERQPTPQHGHGHDHHDDGFSCHHSLLCSWGLGRVIGDGSIVHASLMDVVNPTLPGNKGQHHAHDQEGYDHAPPKDSHIPVGIALIGCGRFVNELKGKGDPKEGRGDDISERWEI